MTAAPGERGARAGRVVGGRRRARGLAVLLVVGLGLLAGAGSPGAAGPAVRLLSEEQLDLESEDPARGPRVDRPYFDADGRLRWDARPVHESAGPGCEPPAAGAGPPWPRRVVLGQPRVDERRCPRPGGPGGTEGTLVGLDRDGRAAWSRPLDFVSGAHRIDRWPLGASAAGVVLATLEVWSPDSGETLVAPRTHPVGAEPRLVPDHAVAGAAAWDPVGRRVYVFQADVTVVRRQGGLHRFDPETGRLALWRPVSASLTGTFDRVETMAASPDGRWLALGIRRAARGPADVALEVIALPEGQVLHRARFGGDGHPESPQVVAAPGGHLGFAYRDLARRQAVLRHFVVGPFRSSGASRP